MKMDIYCPVCGEPWEIDSLHDYADEIGSTFSKVRNEFANHGCGKAFKDWGVTCDCRRGGNRAMVSSAMFDILGDDIDGIASMMEDFGF